MASNGRQSAPRNDHDDDQSQDQPIAPETGKKPAFEQMRRLYLNNENEADIEHARDIGMISAEAYARIVKEYRGGSDKMEFRRRLSEKAKEFGKGPEAKFRAYKAVFNRLYGHLLGQEAGINLDKPIQEDILKKFVPILKTPLLEMKELKDRPELSIALRELASVTGLQAANDNTEQALTEATGQKTELEARKSHVEKLLGSVNRATFASEENTAKADELVAKLQTSDPKLEEERFSDYTENCDELDDTLWQVYQKFHGSPDREKQKLEKDTFQFIYQLDGITNHPRSIRYVPMRGVRDDQTENWGRYLGNLEKFIEKLEPSLDPADRPLVSKLKEIHEKLDADKQALREGREFEEEFDEGLRASDEYVTNAEYRKNFDAAKRHFLEASDGAKVLFNSLLTDDSHLAHIIPLQDLCSDYDEAYLEVFGTPDQPKNPSFQDIQNFCNNAYKTFITSLVRLRGQLTAEKQTLDAQFTLTTGRTTTLGRQKGELAKYESPAVTEIFEGAFGSALAKTPPGLNVYNFAEYSSDIADARKFFISRRPRALREDYETLANVNDDTKTAKIRDQLIEIDAEIEGMTATRTAVLQGRLKGEDPKELSKSIVARRKEKHVLESLIKKAETFRQTLAGFVGTIARCVSMGIMEALEGIPLRDLQGQLDQISTDDSEFSLKQLTDIAERVLPYVDYVQKDGFIHKFNKNFDQLKQNIGLDDSEAAVRIIAAVRRRQNPGLKEEDSIKEARAYLGEQLGLERGRKNLKQLLAADRAELMDPMKMIGLKQKVLGLNYKVGETATKPLGKLKPTDLKDVQSIEALFDNGQLNLENGFILLAGMIELVGDSASISSKQINALENRLMGLLAEDLGAKDAMHVYKVRQVVEEAFEDHLKQARKLAKAYAGHYDKNHTTWDKNEKDFLEKSIKLLNRKLDKKQVEWPDYVRQKTKLLDRAKLRDISLSQDNVLAEWHRRNKALSVKPEHEKISDKVFSGVDAALKETGLRLLKKGPMGLLKFSTLPIWWPIQQIRKAKGHKPAAAKPKGPTIREGVKKRYEAALKAEQETTKKLEERDLKWLEADVKDLEEKTKEVPLEWGKKFEVKSDKYKARIASLVPKKKEGGENALPLAA